MYFEIDNTCIEDLPHERLLNDEGQIGEGLSIAYFSPLQCYIDEAFIPTCCMVKNLNDLFCLQHKLFYDSHTLMVFSSQIYNMCYETLFWLMTKHKWRCSVIDKMLEWLHYLYAYT